MSVRIRLRRIGRKKQPSYRLVVADSATPRDGAYLEAVGFYNPRMQPAELRLDIDRVDEWLGRGANMSDTVASLVRTARKGGDAKIELKPIGGEPRPAPAADVEPAPEPAATADGRAPAASAEEAPASSAQTENVETAVVEAPDAPAEPDPARPKAGQAGTEPPE